MFDRGRVLNSMHWAACVMLSVAICGCASTPSLTQVAAFGDATKSLADNSKKAFSLIDSTTVQRKLYGLAIDPTLGPTDKYFEGLFVGDDKGLRARLDTLDALGAYSAALQSLATADFRKDVDASATALYGSIAGLNGDVKKLSGQSFVTDDRLKLIVTAVDAIGAVVVESKRRDAIKVIVIQADDGVQATSRLLANDFGTNSDIPKFVKQNLINTDGSIRQAYNVERSAKNSTFDLRLTRLQQIQVAYDAEQQSDALFNSISLGAKKVGETHAALKQAVMSDQFSSSDLAVLIGELVNYAQSVQAFYGSFSTNGSK